MSTGLARNDEPIEGVSREGTRGGHFYRPNVDIIELKEELLLKVDMPGTFADKITLDYNKGTLTLHGPVKPRQPEKMRFLVQEYRVAAFHREFIIDEEIDPARVSAEYRAGVLTVHLPKVEAAKPRRISVKAN